MTVFLTGGAGFVGLNVIEQLLARGEDVFSFSLEPPGERALGMFSSLPGKLGWLEGDVRDADAVAGAISESGADRIIHAAVITANRAREERDPGSIVSTNVQGTVNVLEAARRAGAGRFVYVSSASVYGDSATAHERLSEAGTPPLPRSLYAVTKYAAEGVARRYGEIFGMGVVAARLSAVFGRWEHDTGLRDTLSPPYLLAGMAAAGRAAVLPNEGVRDWIYGPDAAAGIIAILDAPTLRYDVYNVSTGKTWSLRQWCERLAARRPGFSFAVRAGAGADPALDPGERSPLSIERVLADTTYNPRYGIAEACEDYLEWSDS